jgi:hypothetical protein
MMPRSRLWHVNLAMKRATALSHEHEVGMKWKMKRSKQSSQARTFAFF